MGWSLHVINMKGNPCYSDDQWWHNERENKSDGWSLWKWKCWGHIWQKWDTSQRTLCSQCMRSDRTQLWVKPPVLRTAVCLTPWDTFFRLSVITTEEWIHLKYSPQTQIPAQNIIFSGPSEAHNEGIVPDETSKKIKAQSLELTAVSQRPETQKPAQII